MTRKKKGVLMNEEITLRQVDNEPLRKLGIRVEDFNVVISLDTIQVGAFTLHDNDQEVKIKEHVHKIESLPVWVCYDREEKEIYFSRVGKGVALAMVHMVGEEIMGWRF
jgi:hypothetical protein